MSTLTIEIIVLAVLVGVAGGMGGITLWAMRLVERDHAARRNAPAEASAPLPRTQPPVPDSIAPEAAGVPAGRVLCPRCVGTGKMQQAGITFPCPACGGGGTMPDVFGAIGAALREPLTAEERAAEALGALAPTPNPWRIVGEGWLCNCGQDIESVQTLGCLRAQSNGLCSKVSMASVMFGNEVMDGDALMNYLFYSNKIVPPGGLPK